MYLDAAVDRVEERAVADHRAQIEAYRAGWIFAHDQKQYDRWHGSTPQRASQGLAGAPLEQAVMHLSLTNPEYVVRG